MCWSAVVCLVCAQSNKYKAWSCLMKDHSNGRPLPTVPIPGLSKPRLTWASITALTREWRPPYQAPQQPPWTPQYFWIFTWEERRTKDECSFGKQDELFKVHPSLWFGDFQTGLASQLGSSPVTLLSPAGSFILSCLSTNDPPQRRLSPLGSSSPRPPCLWPSEHSQLLQGCWLGDHLCPLRCQLPRPGLSQPCFLLHPLFLAGVRMYRTIQI